LQTSAKAYKILTANGDSGKLVLNFLDSNNDVDQHKMSDFLLVKHHTPQKLYKNSLDNFLNYQQNL